LKTPICAFDAKTGLLCPKCEARLKGGHLTKLDVDSSIKLTKLLGKIPNLEQVSLIKAHDVSGDLVLVFSSGDLNTLKNDSSAQQKIDAAFGTKVWIVESSTTDRKMIEDLFYPIPILTVNVVWLPDGSKLTKVIIPGRRTDRFPINVDQVKQIVKSVRNVELLVEFEYDSSQDKHRLNFRKNKPY
tara:strand:+ start:221 stop:778 length:558 start_codon:yes stop_codon:yes gene_type:complete